MTLRRTTVFDALPRVQLICSRCCGEVVTASAGVDPRSSAANGRGLFGSLVTSLCLPWVANLQTGCLALRTWGTVSSSRLLLACGRQVEVFLDYEWSCLSRSNRVLLAADLPGLRSRHCTERENPAVVNGRAHDWRNFTSKQQNLDADHSHGAKLLYKESGYTPFEKCCVGENKD